MKKIFGLVALGGALLIVAMADLIVFILTDTHDADTILILRIMAFVPIISAFNVFSMLNLLLKQARRSIFNIGAVLIGVATVIAYASVYTQNIYFVGSFTILVEGAAWIMYEYAIKKNKVQHG